MDPILTKALDGLMASGFSGIVLLLFVWKGWPAIVAMINDLKTSQKENADRIEASNKELGDRTERVLGVVANALAKSAAADFSRLMASQHVSQEGKELASQLLQDTKRDFPNSTP